MKCSDTTLYRQMQKVALPKLKAYLTDLTVHDLEISQKLVPGEKAIYAVRHYGTHVAIFDSQSDTTPRRRMKTASMALDYLYAILSTGSQIDWYLIQCTAPRRGSMVAVTFDQARQTLKTLIENIRLDIHSPACHHQHPTGHVQSASS